VMVHVNGSQTCRLLTAGQMPREGDARGQ
jgi:hypothetical protein